MISDFPVVLDACVLVPAVLRDTLLRLAEKRLFVPKWSGEIIAEMTRTLQNKLNKTQAQTNYLVGELKKHFGDAWVENYSRIISVCESDEKDRHVLAAAIKAPAELIVTFNLKHFPPASLAPWAMEVSHPDDFLVDLFHLENAIVIHTLHEQAGQLNRTLETQLLVMSERLPMFVKAISDKLGLEAPGRDSGNKASIR
jgi:predicted nucleic acid-binding protein